ncbi:MAG: lamin tail domain-containing protein [Polyangiaceae bacterium]|nr:lamin tail domain-containing protein [Polyangiaceae bacterium]
MLVVVSCLLAACATGTAFDDGPGPTTSSSSSSSSSGGSSSSSGGSSGASSGSSSGSSGSSGSDAGKDVVTPTVDAGSCSLTINEIQSAGTGASAEFIELYNAGSGTCPAGWKIVYRSSSGTTDTAMYSGGKAVGPKAYTVVGGTGYTGTKEGTISSGLAAAGGQLQLRDSSDAPIDSMGYGNASGAFVRGTPAAAPPASQSVGRKPDGTNTNNNSADFKMMTTPTPNAAN